MSDRWYATVGYIVLGACLVLFVFYVTHRQIEVRVAPIEVKQETQHTAIRGLSTSREQQDQRLTAIEARVKKMEARPIWRPHPKAEPHGPTPAFSRESQLHGGR